MHLRTFSFNYTLRRGTEKLKESGLATVGHVLKCAEQDLIDRIEYVGEKRARRIKNAAEAAVLEYLSG
jgi:hypothetical protein